MLISPKRLIQKMFNLVGYNIVRISKDPTHSLLGIRDLSIKTIVDVGSNRGQFVRHISSLFPEAHIYCFEPLPGPYRELKQWVEKERSQKIKTFNIALGDREGTSEILTHIEHTPSSSFLRTTRVCENLYPFTQKKACIPVNLTTLDKWIKTLPGPPTPEILIKLDVQGYEERVIRGGQKTFSDAKACMVEVCLDHLYEDQSTFKDISLLLYDLGYHYAGNLDQRYADNGHVIS
ncbi:MAG: FkbM family methyltransferase, partial [Candidatus Aenigmarchaeota archaeon]|nr:FkbM family methyltransferase [Candidatus Aenigmarchaeota archaeon]